MQNLLLFIIRYGHLLTFLFLESICLYLLVQHNEQQREIFLYSSNLLAGNVYEEYNELEEYLSLKEQNDSLASSNAQLINQLYSLSAQSKLIDTSAKMLYQVIPARIINNQVAGRNNMITINKGKADGVHKSMGVIHPNGVVGIVKQVTGKYASVISILNTEVRISAKVKRSQYFGTLTWEGEDSRVLSLSAIPKHADVRLGDTITTTAYSSIFPPDHPIGVISDIKQPPGRGDFVLEVKMFLDLANIEHVYLVEHEDKEEILTVENSLN